MIERRKSNRIRHPPFFGIEMSSECEAVRTSHSDLNWLSVRLNYNII